MVIPHYGPDSLLDACLASLATQTTEDFQVYVVDNNARLRHPPASGLPANRITLIPMTDNRGFAGGANAGWRAAREPLVALLNNDAVAEPRWLEAAVHFMSANPQLAFGASRILRKDNPGIVDNAGDYLPPDGRPQARGRGQPASRYTQSDWVLSPCGAAAVYRRAALEATGGFDEDFFAYLEDVDLGLRMAGLGMEGRLMPNAVVRHGTAADQRRFSEPRRVRWIQRNKRWLLWKNFSDAALARYASSLRLGGIRSIISNAAQGRLGDWLHARKEALAGREAMMKKREAILAARKITDAQFFELIERSAKALED